jgi:hypothetical protein
MTDHRLVRKRRKPLSASLLQLPSATLERVDGGQIKTVRTASAPGSLAVHALCTLRRAR